MLRIDRGCFVTVVDSELTVDNDEDAPNSCANDEQRVLSAGQHDAVSPYKAIFGLCCGC